MAIRISRALLLFVLLGLLANSAAAQMEKLSLPHLAGSWKGTATRTVCGHPAWSAQVELVLEDHAYKPAGQEIAQGNVTGTLAIDRVAQGVIVANYSTPNLKADVLAMQQVLRRKSVFTSYYFEFTAKDALAGVGYYQTLSGMLEQRNPDCMNLGSQGEVLKVDLKKQ